MSLSDGQMVIHSEDQDDFEIEFLLKELLEDNENNENNSSPSSALTSQDDFSNSLYLQPPEYYQKQANKGRRKSTNPVYMPSLRIFRRDIRRRYGEMFVNVMNNHDSSLLSRFFQEYCHPDCHFFTTRPTNEIPRKILQDSLKKSTDEKYNLGEVIDGFSRNYDLMPDSVFRLETTQVRVKQHEKGSVIIAKARVVGTRLYAIETVENINSQIANSLEDISSFDDASSVATTVSSDSSQEGLESPRTESSSEALEAISSSCFSEHEEYWRKFRWTRLTTPMESYMEAMFTMVLDETNHILRFHLDCQDYYERPAAVSS
mmetsp:Transcript_9803/g.10556  ORF Transcript_9803/g.10556 Transcript_9803/m.10556 type:complete len:318 (-) Transcript_9803:78-1031(-)